METQTQCGFWYDNKWQNVQFIWLAMYNIAVLAVGLIILWEGCYDSRNPDLSETRMKQDPGLEKR